MRLRNLQTCCVKILATLAFFIDPRVHLLALFLITLFLVNPNDFQDIEKKPVPQTATSPTRAFNFNPTCF